MVIAFAGLLAVVALVLFFTTGQPWGTINDLLLIVTIGALPVLMLAFWELGGLTPTPLALTAQVLGWLAAAIWCLTHLLFVLGVVEIDYDASAATGAYLVESVALVYIGLWIGGDTYALTPMYTVVAVDGSGDRGTALFRTRYPDGTLWWVINVYELDGGRIARTRVFFAPEFEAPEWRAPYWDKT